MKPDALTDDCMLATTLKPKHRGRSVYAKVGTMPGEYVFVDHEPVLDATIRFRREGSGQKWQDARVWKLDGDIVFLELW